MNIKQISVDNGTVGGLIAIFSASMVVFGMITFINTTIIAYSTNYYKYISLQTFIILGLILFIIYEYVFYAVIIPSMQKFSNRQAYVHDNPIKSDIFELKQQMNRIEEKLLESRK